MRYLGQHVDFQRPRLAEALASHDGVSWRIFKNPVALLVGGIAAVLLELAHPRVRAGVWNHTSFETRPLRRILRTGFAAMVTVYAPRETAEQVIRRVTTLHREVRGTTEDGRNYAALDPDLLNWVQATASFGFLQAYDTFVRSLPDDAKNRFLSEATIPAALYGATGLPIEHDAHLAYISGMRTELEPSPIVFRFLDRVKRALPWPAAHMAIPCAISILPDAIIEDLELTPRRASPRLLTRMSWLGRTMDSIPLPFSPPYRSMRRMELTTRDLYGPTWWAAEFGQR